MQFSDWLFGRVRRTDTIALARLMQLLFEFLTQDHGVDAPTAAQALWHDYQRGGRHDKPGFLLEHLGDVGDEARPAPRDPQSGPKRQSRHTAAR